MATYSEAKAAGARFYEGMPCRRCKRTQRYVSTNKCTTCSRASALGKTVEPLDDEPIVPTPLGVTRQHPLGQCRHGVGLRAFCRQCETAWYGRQRFGPEIYDDLVSYEPEAVPLNFESSLNGAPARRTRSHKRRGANATPSRRTPRGRPAHAAATQAALTLSGARPRPCAPG